jgi:serine/threonine protein kinase
MPMSLPPRFPRPGELILGKYQIAAAIGGDGSEIVYEARERLTQRLVALRWSLSSADSSRFRHPSVFETLEVGKDRGGLCTVLDWCPGESLEARLGRVGPQPMPEIARLLSPCIRGVMAAHVEGVVQHVIKSTTIYLCATESGQPEQVKLLPFELDPRRGQQLLAAGVPDIETSAHRLPESRAALLADPRADVRAFGAIVYRALTGQPYAARSAVPAPGLQPIERWFIERSLGEACDRPFQTLAELVTALENMSSTMPRAAVDRRSPATRHRDDTPARRHRGPITARQRRIPRQAQGTTEPARPSPRPPERAADSGGPLAVSSTAPPTHTPSTEHPLVLVPTRMYLTRGPGRALAQLPTQPLPRSYKRPELDRTLELSPSVPTVASLSRAAYGIALQLGLGSARQQTRLLGYLAGALVIVALVLTLVPDRRPALTADAPRADTRPAVVAMEMTPPEVAFVAPSQPFTPPLAAIQEVPKVTPSRAVGARRAPRVRSAAPAAGTRRSSRNDSAPSPLASPPREPVRSPPKPAIKPTTEQALDQMSLL